MPGTVPTIWNPTPPGGQLIAAEAGLPSGSMAGQATITSEWVFTIQALDGVASLDVAGYRAISGGVFAPGSADLGYGILAVDHYDPGTGEVRVRFTLTDVTRSQPGPTQRYGDIYSAPIVLTDGNGDQTTSALLVQVRDDDRVQANSDSATAVPGGAAAIGDVTTNDLFSADGFGGLFQIGQVGGASIGVPGAGVAIVQGLHGTLSIAASGAFSYTAAAGAPAGSVDQFRYWTTDGDGDQGAATLSVTIGSAPGVLRGTIGNDSIAGGSGGETILGLEGADTLGGGPGDDHLEGGPGDDLLIGGPGDDRLAGGGGADTFVFDWSAATTATEISLFRNGQHPSGKANAKAWEQYDRQAAERGYDIAVGVAGGHTLWGKAGVISVTYQNESGVDFIGDFNFAEGDRIDIRGLSDLAAFKAQVSAVTSAEYGAEAYDLQLGGVTFLTVSSPAGAAPYSADWFV